MLVASIQKAESTPCSRDRERTGRGSEEDQGEDEEGREGQDRSWRGGISKHLSGSAERSQWLCLVATQSKRQSKKYQGK